MNNRIYYVINHVLEKYNISNDIYNNINSYLHGNVIVKLPEELKLQIIIYKNYDFIDFFWSNNHTICPMDSYVESMVHFLVENKSYESYVKEHNFDKKFIQLLISCVKREYETQYLDEELYQLYKNGNLNVY
jgi:hypothetical protein